MNKSLFDCKMLVTGVTSGLGKYIHEKTGAEGWRRGEPYPKDFYDVIVHCAHDREELHSNLAITNNLLDTPHNLFIYISSIDIYNPDQWNKNGIVKHDCEQTVKKRATNFLIYRCSALIGEYMKPNHLTKIIGGTNEKLGLSGESTFGYVKHATAWQRIEAHIRKAERNKTFYLVGNPLKLSDIAIEFDVAVRFGKFKYTTPKIHCGIDSRREIHGYLTEMEIKNHERALD